MSIDRLNTRFTRYFFGRIEKLLADGMKLQMKHELKELVTLRGAKTGFHIEHILSRNPNNLSLLATTKNDLKLKETVSGEFFFLKERTIFQAIMKCMKRSCGRTLTLFIGTRPYVLTVTKVSWISLASPRITNFHSDRWKISVLTS